MRGFASFQENASDFLNGQHDEADSEPAAIFRLLVADRGVSKAWDRLAKHEQVTASVVLSLIVETRALARLNRDIPELSERDAGGYAGLLRAAELLSAHYEKKPTIARADGGDSPAIAEFNNAILSSRAALFWMIKDIQQGARMSARFHEIVFPSSQKRQDERLAFAQMLSARMEFWFGQPFQSFVITICAALYPSNDPINMESFKKARSREKRRAAG